MENGNRKGKHSLCVVNHGRNVLALLSCLAFLEFGCTGSYTVYPYRAATNNCNCEEYRVSGSRDRVEYRFRAQYTMDNGIVTSIEIEFTNNSGTDTLMFEHSAVKISSRNVSYQYNDKFLPIPLSTIPPRHSDHVTLNGREVTGVEDWNKIAGEQLTITIKGLRLREKELPQQSVVFIPMNPKFGKL